MSSDEEDFLKGFDKSDHDSVHALDSKFESLGEPEIRRRLESKIGLHSLEWDHARAWLAAKETERNIESLSISRKALSNSRLATRISISAIVLSIAMALLRIVEWYSSK